jgi:hypothetical protein
MRWRGAALTLFMVLFFLGGVVAPDSFFDIFIELDAVDDLEKECVRDCRNMRDAERRCRDMERDAMDVCRDAKKEANEECNELRGRDRSNCRREVNQVHRECRAEAGDIKKLCLRRVDNNEDLCKLECRFSSCEMLVEDSDGDGVLDLLDNCPFHVNEDQSDLNGNGIGDVCDGVFCCTGGLLGECFFAQDEGACRESGGAVMNCLPPLGLDGLPEVKEFKNETHNPFNTNDPPYNASDSLFVDLAKNVTASGVNNTAYNPGSYECADFAGDLERNLTARGYNATFTAYWCHGGIGNPAPTAHAITDVHLPDGRLVWIEPQTNRMINMDMDGDGVVEYDNNAFTNSVAVTTDDNCQISVWEDRAAAANAGVPGA